MTFENWYDVPKPNRATWRTALQKPGTYRFRTNIHPRTSIHPRRLRNGECHCMLVTENSGKIEESIIWVD